MAAGGARRCATRRPRRPSPQEDDDRDGGEGSGGQGGGKGQGGAGLFAGKLADLYLYAGIALPTVRASKIDKTLGIAAEQECLSVIE